MSTEQFPLVSILAVLGESLRGRRGGSHPTGGNSICCLVTPANKSNLSELRNNRVVVRTHLVCVKARTEQRVYVGTTPHFISPAPWW